MISRTSLSALALIWALRSVNSLHAQGVATGRISGTLTDEFGAVLVGAQVQATNLETRNEVSTVSDSGGRFTVANLAIGLYDIRASTPGFDTVVRTAVVLTVGADVVVDFSLKVGAARQEVIVSAHVSRVETETGAVSTLVTSEQLHNLPLNGRNFEQLISLAPGVSVSSSNFLQVTGGATSATYGNQDNYSISGSRPEGIAFLLDNTDISDFFNHGTGSGVAGTTLGVDAIAEFQILTNTYSAQFGGTGAAVNIASRSGTNHFHGGAYEFLRNNKLDSRGYFDVDSNGKPAPAPPYRRDQFGGRLGGPLRKDKLFFFANYEGLHSSLGQTGIAYVPEPYVLKGQVCSVNPQSLSPRATACPSSDLVQVVPSVAATQAAILAVYPKPASSAPDLGSYAPFPEVATLTTDEQYGLGRIDYSISSRDSLFARYVIDRVNLTNPFGGSVIPLWTDHEITRNQYATMEERHISTPSTLNLFRVSFVHTDSEGKSTGNVPPLNLFPAPGHPNTTVSPGGGLSIIGADTGVPFRFIQNKTFVGDDWVWTAGPHHITAGASIGRVQSIFVYGLDGGGVFYFFTLPHFLQGSADLYYGAAAPAPDYNSSRGFRQVDLFPYIQDDWHVLPNLTLNLGLRWDFVTDAVGSGTPLEALINPLTDAGYTVVRHALAHNPNWSNYDPRLSFAYDPYKDHKTSIHGGLGIFHEQVEARTYAPGYSSSPPSALALDQPPLGGIPFPSFPAGPPFNGLGFGYEGITHAPYVIQYNFGLQREVFRHAVASLAFVGSHGVHLFNQVNQNLPIPCSQIQGPLPQWCPPIASGAPGSAGNPFSGELTNPNFGPLPGAIPVSTSRYNSLQASFNRQFGQGFQVQASYSWAKCTDDGSATYPLENSWGRPNPFDLSSDRGPCSFNRAQNIVINALYELPVHGSRLAAGWRVAGIVTGATGLPIDVQDGYDQSLGGLQPRPNYSGAAGCHPFEILHQAISGPAIQYFNPACYTLEPLGTQGDVGRNSIHGPALFNVDFSIIKRTRVTEKLDSEFRAEIFNLFDRANFGLPNPELFTGGPAGQITSLATPPRQVQFAIRLVF